MTGCKGRFFLKKGLTLIEILWSVVLLAIIIVTVTGVLTGIVATSKKSDKLVTATNLAQKQLEYLKLVGFENIPVPVDMDGRTDMGTLHNGSYFPPYPPNQPAYLQEIVDGVLYYYKINTSYVSGSNNNLISIKVKVYWDDPNGKGKNSVKLELFKVR